MAVKLDMLKLDAINNLLLDHLWNLTQEFLIRTW